MPRVREGNPRLGRVTPPYPGYPKENEKEMEKEREREMEREKEIKKENKREKEIKKENKREKDVFEADSQWPPLRSQRYIVR